MIYKVYQCIICAKRPGIRVGSVTVPAATRGGDIDCR